MPVSLMHWINGVGGSLTYVGTSVFQTMKCGDSRDEFTTLATYINTQRILTLERQYLNHINPVSQCIHLDVG